MNAHAASADGPCEVIPVIDLMDGLVVHAHLGDRAHYRPIRSKLCGSARIEDVVSALLGLHRFERLYIADIDALLGRARQLSAIDTVRRIAPALSLWIDAGIRDDHDLAAIAERGTPVLATETLTAQAAERLFAACPRAVLSVDYRGERLLGEAALLERLSRGPSDVIAMDLARVGSGAGPDLTHIAALRRVWPGSRLYAAGGVRDALDLRRSCEAGAAGVLVASALHDGRIQRSDLTAT
ncbi:MAG TPA: HisA/HisF-related TIM barrel protein [Burkholderiaceae bacterium]|jgi:phosphoribosylformimino-5-aminoimidazole carboxamide ribotide isomerase|nr:HisA/HisF-related TIM barrel protein [Burkholderiaceae bacterium]